MLAGLRPALQVFLCVKSQAMAQFMLYEDGRGSRLPCIRTSLLWEGKSHEARTRHDCDRESGANAYVLSDLPPPLQSPRSQLRSCLHERIRSDCSFFLVDTCT